MTDEEFKEFADRVIALLEIIAFGNGPVECQHQHTEDHSVMGQGPQTQLFCLDCKQYISQEQCDVDSVAIGEE